MMDSLWFVIVLVLLAVVNLRESRADHRLKAEHHTAPAAHHPNRSKLHKTLRRVGADSGSRPRPTTKSSFPTATGSSRDASRRLITTLYRGGG